MAEIRLNKLIKKYNIGLSELVDFLRKQGAEVDESPNAKVSDEYVEKLDKQFGKDLEMAAEAAKLEIKLTNIIEKNNSSKAAREEEEGAEETISYKDNSLSGKKLAPAPAAEPEPAVSEQPAAEPVLAEEPAASEQPVAELSATEPAATEPERAEEVAPADEPDYEEPQESAPAQPDARQALAERGKDTQDAGRMTGVAVYGILMMARRGEMTLQSACEMFLRILGCNTNPC